MARPIPSMMREKRSAVSHKQYHIRAEGPEHVLLTGDFGQADAPYFDDAMVDYLEKMSPFFHEAELAMMICENLEKVLGIRE